jgi:hypothetical protein
MVKAGKRKVIPTRPLSVHCTALVHTDGSACGNPVGQPTRYNTAQGEWFTYDWPTNEWVGPFFDGYFCGSHWPRRQDELVGAVVRMRTPTTAS